MDNFKMTVQSNTFAKSKLERINHNLLVVDSDLARINLYLKTSPTSKSLNRSLGRKLKYRERLLNAMVHARLRVDSDQHNRELEEARKAMSS